MTSKKANESKLNSLHLMVADSIAKLMTEAQGDSDMMLKVIKEARGFLKDNNVSADIAYSSPLREIQNEVKVAELPFEVEED